MKPIILSPTPQLQALFTIIRDEKTPTDEFVFSSQRIMRLLIEEALNLLPVKEKNITTPTQTPFAGVTFQGSICAVTIMRAGDAMENIARQVCKKIRIGKILIQRNEKNARPELFYTKLPKDIAERWVLLLDPMLATGGSVCKAIEILKQHNVKENKIIFVNLIACPEGITNLSKQFPHVHIVTGVVDKSLNKQAYILPGLGDFGDRYFGT